MYQRIPALVGNFNYLPRFADSSSGLLLLAPQATVGKDSRGPEVIGTRKVLIFSHSWRLRLSTRIPESSRGGRYLRSKSCSRIKPKPWKKAIRGHKEPRQIVGRSSIIAPNSLDLVFTVNPPDEVWVTDVTYVHTR